MAPDIQTEKAEISAVVEQKKINDLPLDRAQRAGARRAAARHQRHPEHRGLPDRRTGHGRHRERRAPDRQQRERRWRQRQQRPMGRDRAARAQRRGGAGIPGHRQQSVRGVRQKLGRDGQHHHQRRHQRLQRLRLPVPPERKPARARVLREPQPAEGGLPPQRLRRKHRRADPARQLVLLLLDGGRPRADRQLVQRDGRDAAARQLRERHAPQLDRGAAVPPVSAGVLSRRPAPGPRRPAAGRQRVEHHAGRHPRRGHYQRHEQRSARRRPVQPPVRSGAEDRERIASRRPITCRTSRPSSSTCGRSSTTRIRSGTSC